MYRAQITGNKICNRVWQIEAQEKHKRRLNKTKSHIDSKPPTVYSHLVMRSKKEQQLEEKYNRIEYENKLLLKKMTAIMKKKPKVREPSFRVRSLNAVIKKNETKRILEENQAILKRIISRKPNYNRKQWAKHAATHSGYKNNIREKPVEKLARRIQQSAPAAKSRQGERLRPLHVLNSTQKDRNHVSQGGHNIDGQYVLVTVDEVKQPHALYFRTYDLETSEQCGIKVTFEEMKAIIEDEGLLHQSRREELANHLLPRLRFRDEQLVLDTSPQAAGAATTATPGKRNVKSRSSVKKRGKGKKRNKSISSMKKEARKEAKEAKETKEATEATEAKEAEKEEVPEEATAEKAGEGKVEEVAEDIPTEETPEATA